MLSAQQFEVAGPAGKFIHAFYIYRGVTRKCNSNPVLHDVVRAEPTRTAFCSTALRLTACAAHNIMWLVNSGSGGKKSKKNSFPIVIVVISLPLTPSVGSTPEVVAVTPGLIITTAPGTEKIQTRPRGAPSTRGHAGSVSLHAHIPGDIASFTTQHGAEGAVLTTTSQCEFRSLVYL